MVLAVAKLCAGAGNNVVALAAGALSVDEHAPVPDACVVKTASGVVAEELPLCVDAAEDALRFKCKISEKPSTLMFRFCLT